MQFDNKNNNNRGTAHGIKDPCGGLSWLKVNFGDNFNVKFHMKS